MNFKSFKLNYWDSSGIVDMLFLMLYKRTKVSVKNELILSLYMILQIIKMN